jgi:hypothetical protein
MIKIRHQNFASPFVEPHRRAFPTAKADLNADGFRIVNSDDDGRGDFLLAVLTVMHDCLLLLSKKGAALASGAGD